VVGTWGTGNPTLATNWAYANTPAASIDISDGFPARFTVGNIAVPDGANNLALFIWTPATFNSSDYFEARNVQLEIGAVATDFVARSFGDEQRQVQKFYVPFDYVGLGGTWLSASEAFCYVLFPVEMRAAPTFTLLDTSPQFIEVTTGGAATNRGGTGSAITSSTAGTKSGVVTVNGFSGVTAGSFAGVSGAQIGINWLGASARL
jgi:hypothetical protein